MNRSGKVLLTLSSKLTAIVTNVSLRSIRCFGNSYLLSNRLPSSFQVQPRWHQKLKSTAIPWPGLTVPCRCLRIPALPPKYKYMLDQVPPTYSLVYESGIRHYISVMYTSLVVFGLSSATLLLFKSEILLSQLNVLEGLIFAGTCAMFVLVATYMYSMSQKILIRIYYDQQSGRYLAVRRTILGQLRQLTYVPSEVQVSDTKENTKQIADFVIKGEKCYISAEHFTSHVYYYAHVKGENERYTGLSQEHMGRPKF